MQRVTESQQRETSNAYWLQMKGRVLSDAIDVIQQKTGEDNLDGKGRVGKSAQITLSCY